MPITNQPVRTATSYTVVLLFLVSFLWAGLRNRFCTSLWEVLALGNLPFGPSNHLIEQDYKGFPDFGHYILQRTIFEDELALDHQRLIFVGDIHGMKSSLDKLLSTLSYDSSHDLLVHLGDIVSKGPDSLQVLAQFSDANATGVRGNHDQKVIEWRAWIEWVERQPGGRKWLEKLERQYPKGFDTPKNHKASNRLKWPIPKGWKFMADHYTIARSMTASHYSYLKSLPLVIHLPSLHTYAAHAGILPFNPKYAPDASNQPLARPPDPSTPSPTRTVQERALVTDIEQNSDPWVLLNMRSILSNGRVSRKSNVGTPWSELWNMIMEQCHGYFHMHGDGATKGRQNDLTSASSNLRCLPINIVYGHAAARGLDIKRWSFGLDTSCVKGRQLTAMVVSNKTDSISISETQTREVAFGESMKAQLVSVPCST